MIHTAVPMERFVLSLLLITPTQTNRKTTHGAFNHSNHHEPQQYRRNAFPQFIDPATHISYRKRTMPKMQMQMRSNNLIHVPPPLPLPSPPISCQEIRPPSPPITSREVIVEKRRPFRSHVLKSSLQWISPRIEICARWSK